MNVAVVVLVQLITQYICKLVHLC